MTEGNEHMGKELITLNLVINEKMEEMIRAAVYEIDKNKSEIVRCCILLALPTIMKCPSLINRIQIEDFKVNDK